MKKLFAKIKWFITEIMNIYSTNDSFFSKKRIESGIAFIIGEFGMVYWLLMHIQPMTSSDLGIWAAIQFAIAGYTVYQIQKEKANTPTDPPVDPPVQ